MSENLLQAQVREFTGKEFAKKLRKQGKVPGIFYTQNESPIPIVLDERETVRILTAESGLIDFQIGTKRKRKVIIKEVQTDPVKQSLLHVDVLGVRLKDKINIEVPINLIGEAIGVKDQGGILHQYLRSVEVSCLPLDIPEGFDVDVTNLNVGDSIALESLSMENVEVLGDPEQPIVNVTMPTVAKEPVVEEEEVEGAEEEAAAEEDVEHAEEES